MIDDREAVLAKVPHLARACGSLYVFQRTPSSVDVRDNQPTDPEWFASIATPGWQQRWLENFTANQSGGSAGVDLQPAGSFSSRYRREGRIGDHPGWSGGRRAGVSA